MSDRFDPLLKKVGDYYTNTVNEFGPTSQGVNWNNEESQYLRFKQLTQLINTSDSFSICDYGCGYGALYDYLHKTYTSFEYSGIDVSLSMLNEAKKLYPQTRFLLSSEISTEVDYVIASGVFNVYFNSEENWQSYIKFVLNNFNRMTRRGFAFNCLTSYSDKTRMKDTLHYADPCEIFDFCKKNFSKNIALLHDYDLYEFTILVRK